jgi:hypothetical protein
MELQLNGCPLSEAQMIACQFTTPGRSSRRSAHKHPPLPSRHIVTSRVLNLPLATMLLSPQAPVQLQF